LKQKDQTCQTGKLKENMNQQQQSQKIITNLSEPAEQDESNDNKCLNNLGACDSLVQCQNTNNNSEIQPFKNVLDSNIFNLNNDKTRQNLIADNSTNLEWISKQFDLLFNRVKEMKNKNDQRKLLETFQQKLVQHDPTFALTALRNAVLQKNPHWDVMNNDAFMVKVMNLYDSTQNYEFQRIFNLFNHTKFYETVKIVSFVRIQNIQTFSHF